MRWTIPSVNPAATKRLADELGISPLVARILVLRGVDTSEAAQRFLHPQLSQIHDPYLMADMPAAVARIRQAVERREKILIYGDYDVDGTMAVVVLLTALRTLGASVEPYIPHRLADGYGMRVPVVEQAARDGYRVVLSVDTGIREHEVIARSRELGVDVIVTDHHQPDRSMPPAVAVLNPRRFDCAYPEKNLAGVGVAFKLAQALLGRRLSERVAESYLKLVAIGTVADVVPLVGENRVIARFGLAGLGASRHAGLQALLELAGLAGGEVSAGDVAFRIAPRLNAAGRMEDARQVIELFTSSDTRRAREIAERLDALNRQRQQVEDEIVKAIVAIIEKDRAKAEKYFLVFSGEGWHRGVIGIVAQRVVERYYRPAVVIGVEGGQAQGSGRSINGFNLLAALTEAGDLFERFGGHAQAAGFTLPAERLGELERRLEEYTRARLGPADLEPAQRVDAEVSLEDLTSAFFKQLQALAPFGCGNPTPVFAARGVVVAEPPRVLKEKHLKVRLAQGDSRFDALMWRRADLAPRLVPGQRVDAAFTLEENEYQGAVSLQLMLRDLRIP